METGTILLASYLLTLMLGWNVRLESTIRSGTVRVLEPKRTVQRTEGGSQQRIRRGDPPLPPLFPRCPQSSAIGYDWHCTMCTIRVGGGWEGERGWGGAGKCGLARSSVSLHAPRVTSHVRVLLPPTPVLHPALLNYLPLAPIGTVCDCMSVEEKRWEGEREGVWACTRARG